MSWNFHIKKELEKEKPFFLDIIENFNSLGNIIFKERNTLRKIESGKLDSLAVKSFKIPNFPNQYIYTNIRKSKAYRSFHNAEILMLKGIKTPPPLAYFEEKQNGKLLRSFYFSKYYVYDFTFRELIEQKESFSDWNYILEMFTHFIFQVHEAGIKFKDLSPGNVLIKKKGTEYEFSLIDLNRMSFHTLSLEERLQNFIRLSLTDEMIPIIGNTYSEFSKQDKNLIINTLTRKNNTYKKEKERKKNIKKLIGIN